MTPRSPLRDRQEAYVRRPAELRRVEAASRPGAAEGHRAVTAEIEYLPYGVGGESDDAVCEIVAGYGEIELEYAALRRGAGLLDCPQRGMLIATGGERIDFLDRMLTQRLADLRPGVARTSFWLNRKGRIEADLLLVETGERTLIGLDLHQAAAVAHGLGEFVFTEDVLIEDRSKDLYRLAVHGPRARAAVAAAAGGLGDLAPGAAEVVSIEGHEVTVARRDEIGDTGLELFVEQAAAGAVWDALMVERDDPTGLRPVGWYAYNTARIEAGTPLFNVDFGATNVPHETGVVSDRVSFAKGCYLGQEIVARMENLGQPKQVIMGLRMEHDLLPEAGAPVYAHAAEGPGDPVGVVTSSTLSPMLGAAPVALAMLRSSVAEEGTTVIVHAEGGQTNATVVDRVLWERSA